VSVPDDPRLAEASRDGVFDAFVAQHPDAFVVAITPVGLFTDMPDGLRATGLRPIEADGTTLALTIPEDHQAMLDAWFRVLAEGLANCTFHPVGTPDELARMHYIDMTHRWGVFVAMVTGQSGSSARLTLEAGPIRPRMITARRDAVAKMIGVDPAVEIMLGWTPAELLQMRSLDIVHPDDHQRAIGGWLDMMSAPEGAARRVRVRYLHKNGTTIWMEVTNHNHLADPVEPHVLTEMLDISDEMAAQEALRASEQLLRRLTETLPMGVLQVDAGRRITYQNERTARVLGTVVGDHLGEEQLRDVVPGDREAVGYAVDSVLAGAGDRDIEYGLRDRARGLRRIRAALRALENDDRQITGAIISLADVTEDVRLREELHRRATYDALTGCRNRASTIAALDEFSEPGRSRGTAVVFIDLNEFKQVNDRYGHAVGDQLLTYVAGRLRNAVRDGDVVGRFGGDEFVVVCRDVSTPMVAQRIGETLLAALDAEGPELDLPDGRTLRPQASIGVAWARPGPDATDPLIARADAAMYAAKKARTGRLVLMMAD
jgi:diguanylate cyclase (GGDEF)-like protein/PAS domain S-box-containing protein